MDAAATAGDVVDVELDDAPAGVRGPQDAVGVAVGDALAELGGDDGAGQSVMS
ncbi:hypothetical protein OG429_07135 [Streptomyces sp. NBC_00190]|nr:hypothetical protein [Streptomyces sp. NBC_00190]